MNTPQPCVQCKNLHYDTTLKDTPNNFYECKLELPLGNKECPKFEDYKSE